MKAVGDMAIPGLLIPLGAVLAAGPGQTTLPLRVVVGLVLVKLLLLPLLGGGMVLAAHAWGWLKAPDNLFMAVLLSAHGLQSGQLIMNVAAMFSNHEADVGTVLFW